MFKKCLMGLKFPHYGKNQNDFNELIIEEFTDFLVLKSISQSGDAGCRCVINKKYFQNKHEFKEDRKQIMLN